MSERLLPLKDRSSTWLLYIGLLCVVSAVCFGSLRHHYIYFHDDETFRDNVAISRDFSFFFSPEKEQFTGRPVAELAKWVVARFGEDMSAEAFKDVQSPGDAVDVIIGVAWNLR